LGERPYHPFSVRTEDKRVVANERTEVHLGQQDFIGPITLDGESQAIYLTLALDGAAAIDALVLPEAEGKRMLDAFTKQPGPVTPLSPPLLDEPVLRAAEWKRYVVAPKGRYYLVLDNSGAAGRTTPPSGPADGLSARTDVLLLVGERP
jgi:hypothetical protein